MSQLVLALLAKFEAVFMGGLKASPFSMSFIINLLQFLRSQSSIGLGRQLSRRGPAHSLPQG